MSDVLSKNVETYFQESYKYYITFEDNLISDGEYDYICFDLLENWKELNKTEKRLLVKDALAAGTGFDISMETYKEVFQIIQNKGIK